MPYTPVVTGAAADEAYKWARLLLTGDEDANEPTIEQMTSFRDSEVRKLVAKAPCLAEIDSASDPDKAAYAEALGMRIATRVQNSPIAETLGDLVGEVRIGPITFKPGTQPTKEELTAAYEKGEAEALSTISCIREAGRRVPTVSLFALAGRRRTLQGGR